MKPPHRSHGASRRSCDRCGAPVICQKEGLPWAVTVDDARLTPDAAAELAGPNRLAFCLRESKWSGMRLVEVLRVFHSPACACAHVIEHECPPGTPMGPKPEGALW